MSVTYFSIDDEHTLSKELFTDRLITNYPKVVAVDVETISLSERMPVGFSIATSPREAFYFRLLPERDREIELIEPLLRDVTVTKVFHNALFDIGSLPLITEVDTSNIYDTNTAARFLGFEDTSLTGLASEVHREAVSMRMLLKKGETTLDLDPIVLAKKCCVDSMVTLSLYEFFKDKILKDYMDVEMKVIPILVRMGLRGVKIDQSARELLVKRHEVERNFFEEICTQEGFNPRSPKQTAIILSKRRNFLPVTKGRTSLKTDEETLEFLDDPIAQAVLGFRHHEKLLSTYLLPLEGKDRIYTTYGDTYVGRTSSSGMNMQNIPQGEFRNMFLPDSGVFTTGDWSQLHTRIIAHFSQDRNLLRVYEDNEMGGDLHQYFANMMRVPRHIGKTINLAIPYGATVSAVSKKLKTKDYRLCGGYLDFWFKTFPDAHEWIIHAQNTALRTGWTLPTLFGRVFKIPEGEREDEVRRKGVNYPVIGSDGEILKRGLVMCDEKGLDLAIQVHDSITVDGDVEFPEAIEHIALPIPFSVKRTLRWE